MNKYLTKLAANRYEAFLDSLVKSHPSLSNPKILQQIANRQKAKALASDASKLVTYTKEAPGKWQLKPRSATNPHSLTSEQIGELELGARRLDQHANLIRHNRFLTRFGD